MKREIFSTDKGTVARFSELDPPIGNASDFLDLMAGAGSDIIALDRAGFSDAFYDLKTGLAGELLQKISNYRKRLIIIGDFSELPRRSLRDFVYESNRTGVVLFVPSLADGMALLQR